MSFDNDNASVLAEYEETSPSRLPPRPPTPSGSSQSPVPMEVAGPVLLHISSIILHAEDTVTALAEDMELSSVAYLARRATGKELESQIDLAHLSNLLRHVMEFSTSDAVTGYLDGVEKVRLEKACNSVSTSFCLISEQYRVSFAPIFPTWLPSFFSPLQTTRPWRQFRSDLSLIHFRERKY
jgi:hypothetical protein